MSPVVAQTQPQKRACNIAITFQIRALGTTKRAHDRRCDAFETIGNAGHSSALALRHRNDVPSIGLTSHCGNPKTPFTTSSDPRALSRLDLGPIATLAL